MLDRDRRGIDPARRNRNQLDARNERCAGVADQLDPIAIPLRQQFREQPSPRIDPQSRLLHQRIVGVPIGARIIRVADCDDSVPARRAVCALGTD